VRSAPALRFVFRDPNGDPEHYPTESSATAAGPLVTEVPMKRRFFFIVSLALVGGLLGCEVPIETDDSTSPAAAPEILQEGR
jgi:hypothetical protein